MSATGEPTTGSIRRHTEHGEERKQQLIDAAAELFSTNGYAATRIADICRSAGVAKGLFYWYFPTKGDLFVELAKSMRSELRRTQADAMDPEADPITRIGQGAEASVRFIADHAAYFTLLDVERSDRDIEPVLREGGHIYLDDVRRLVVEGQAVGQIPDVNADLLAVGVVGAVVTFTNSFRSGRLDGVADVDELSSFVRRWITAALG